MKNMVCKASAFPATGSNGFVKYLYFYKVVLHFGLVAAWQFVLGIQIGGAWSEAGHQVIDLMVYDRLSEEQRMAYVNLLRQHPCFERHFLGEMPIEVWRGNDVEKNQWIFAHAGHWPDLIRSESNVVARAESEKYHHASWHFQDRPIFLFSKSSFETAALLNKNTQQPAVVEEGTLHVVQALDFVTSTLEDPETSQADLAISLCWLLHLVADMHQPCHSASLFSEKLLPAGDNGANQLQLHNGTLHKAWDDAILERPNFIITKAKAKRLVALLDDLRDRPDSNSTYQDWLDESHALAKQVVYAQEIRDTLIAWEQTGTLGVLEISREYRTQMRKVASERATLAAYRLASILKTLQAGSSQSRDD